LLNISASSENTILRNIWGNKLCNVLHNLWLQLILLEYINHKFEVGCPCRMQIKNVCRIPGLKRKDYRRYYCSWEDNIKMNHLEIVLKMWGRLLTGTKKAGPLATFCLPQFQEAVGSSLQPASLRLAGSMSSHMRVQDRELIEMIDDGYCLSMHQPWASLLVAGIKVYVLLK